MDEQTVNEELDFSEPEATDQTAENHEPAVEVTSEQSTSPEQGEDSAADSTEETKEAQTDDEIEAFLAKKGVKMDDPDALRKVADMYRNVERDYEKKSQAKAALERQLANSQQTPPPTSNQAALAEVRSLKTEMSVKEWKQAKNLSPETEQKIQDYLAQPVKNSAGQIVINPQTGDPVPRAALVVEGILSLDDVYTLVGGDSVKTDELKSDLRDQIRKEVAIRQGAKRPSASATNSAQFGKKEESDPFLEGLLEE